MVGAGLAGSGVARSGPAGAVGGVAWRVSVEGGSGVGGPVVSVSGGEVGHRIGCAGWGVDGAMRMVGFREVRIVPTKEPAVSCGESPRAVCADRILVILKHFDNGASLVPLGGVASRLVLD